MKKTKKSVRIICSVLAALVVCVAVFTGVYYTRLKTVSSIEKITSYDDGYNIYTMNVEYDYDFDAIVDSGAEDDEGLFDAISKEVFPFLPLGVDVPSFGCTAFNLTGQDGEERMGRNYDFSLDTSALVIYCNPKDGYKSVSVSALDNIDANVLEDGLMPKLKALSTPFLCLDGMNEKGVSVGVLVVDSEPVHQKTEKPNLFTSMLIRLVLDRAATTEEAIELISRYDMIASLGKDYHFYINDANGDGRIVEWDCESETRELVATPTDVVTNFYEIYADRVLPNQKNGIYGHGKERYNAVHEVFNEQKDNMTNGTAWDALKAASQVSDPNVLTSNTQWSIVYNNTDLTTEIVLRRNWNDVYKYSLTDNEIKKFESDESSK